MKRPENRLARYRVWISYADWLEGEVEIKDYQINKLKGQLETVDLDLRNAKHDLLVMTATKESFEKDRDRLFQENKELNKKLQDCQDSDMVADVVIKKRDGQIKELREAIEVALGQSKDTTLRSSLIVMLMAETLEQALKT